jgi:hypothetical protein
MEVKMRKKYVIFILPLIALIAIGMMSGDVYSLGHFKSQGGPGGTVVDCNTCHDFVNGGYYLTPPPPSGYNLRWVNTTINSRTVKFRYFTGSDTLADGNSAALDGPCEVCHHPLELFTDQNGNGKWDLGEPLTDANRNGLCDPGESYTDVDHNGQCDPGTKYHDNVSNTVPHYDGMDCTVCHPHFLDDIVNYFEPRFPGNQSHFTHFDDPKGPMFAIKRPNDYCTYYCHSTTLFSLFNDGQPLATTTVCNPCHGKTGSFDGVDNATYGAKPNWDAGIYKPAVAPEAWPGHLQDGKEEWCAGCHDNGFGSSRIFGVDAPNVMGDNAIYGYDVSGHGAMGDPPIKCEDCHDLTAMHTDGIHRTYTVANDNYKDGYRLSEGMSVPRFGQWGPNAFELCVKCHVFSDVTGPDSLFRDDNKKLNLHAVHLGSVYAEKRCWDSDWRGGACLNPGTQGEIIESCDSAISCTACHNVHGSGMDTNGDTVVDAPCPPMIRHGELISTPGTLDKSPSLDFHWFDIAGDYTATLTASERGQVKCATSATWDVSYNNVCWGCHTTKSPYYDRSLGGPVDLSIVNVWTSDGSNTPKYFFNRGDTVRYHVTFSITGGATYFIKTPIAHAKSKTGVTWDQQLASKSASLGQGEYDWYWQNTIPSYASPGSLAEVVITVRMLTKKGGTLLDKDTRGALFEIQ